MMFRCIGLCQDCICVVDPQGQLLFSGSSVDEVCLLNFTKTFKHQGHFTFRSKEQLKLENGPNGEETYDIVKVFDFTAERKTMSVVLRSVKDSKFHVFAKGADSTMI